MDNVLQNYCSKEWYEFILFHSKLIDAKKDDFIFKVDEKTQGIFIISAGKIKVIKKFNNTTERIIRLASDGDIIGHRGFGGEWKYTVSAIALENSKLLFIPLEIFNDVIHTNSKFSNYMMMLFAEELRESERLASQLPVKNIVASTLLNNLQVFGYDKESTTKLAYTLSRKDMASQAGIRYETLVRMLAEFNNEKLIKIDKKSIHILDENKLVQLKEGLE